MQTILSKILVLFLLTSPGFALGQNWLTDDDVVQFTGVIVTADSLDPVPYTNIVIKNRRKGTTSDFYGYFFFCCPKEGYSPVFSHGFQAELLHYSRHHYPEKVFAHSRDEC